MAEIAILIANDIKTCLPRHDQASSYIYICGLQLNRDKQSKSILHENAYVLL